jgi:hypothetical protein
MGDSHDIRLLDVSDSGTDITGEDGTQQNRGSPYSQCDACPQRSRSSSGGHIAGCSVYCNAVRWHSDSGNTPRFISFSLSSPSSLLD